MLSPTRGHIQTHYTILYRGGATGIGNVHYAITIQAFAHKGDRFQHITIYIVRRGNCY